MSEDLKAEFASFRSKYPEIETLEVLLADMNGIFRGKQMPISALEKIAEGKLCFPITTPFLTTNGANAEETLDEFGSDPDRPCVAVAGSLKTMPWAGKPMAQLQIDMLDSDGEPIFASPRHILTSVLAKLAGLGLTPVTAIEYEFFLFKVGTQPPEPLRPPNGLPHAADANCYNLEVFSDYQPLMQEIEDAAIAQGLPVEGLVCEYGNGQFEVNLMHGPDALKACDDALLLKRVIRGVAHKHGLLASFMAKPLNDEVGNGLHAHVSLLNEAGENVFAGEGGEALLQSAVAGMLATMPAATAFFAPNANSYRRFDAEWFAPVVKNWGENNRRLALRLPLSDKKNRRFEHRVSGADASPHLVMACILAGVHHGLSQKLSPPKPLGEFDLVDFDDVLPPRWRIALSVLEEDEILTRYLGEKFCRLYHQVRSSEEDEAHRSYFAADHQQYLRIL